MPKKYHLAKLVQLDPIDGVLHRLELPMPDGSLQPFELTPISNFHQVLADRYPGIQSYSLQIPNRGFQKGRLSMGPNGMYAVINDQQGQLEQVIVDENLMTHDIINCHPLVNTATTAIGRDDLLSFIRGCGHEPRIMQLNDETASEAVNS